MVFLCLLCVELCGGETVASTSQAAASAAPQAAGLCQARESSKTRRTPPVLWGSPLGTGGVLDTQTNHLPVLNEVGGSEERSGPHGAVSGAWSLAKGCPGSFSWPQ